MRGRRQAVHRPVVARQLSHRLARLHVPQVYQAVRTAARHAFFLGLE
jgi:hypothetical protein